MARFLFRAMKVDRGVVDGSASDGPPFELEVEARNNGEAIAKGTTEFSSRFPEKDPDEYSFAASGPL